MITDTVRPELADEELEKSDFDAILKHAFGRAPLDPEVARRVNERAERITAEIERLHGVMDDETFQTLLDEDA